MVEPVWYREGRNGSQSIPPHLRVQACMTASGTCIIVFINDVTAEQSNRVNYDYENCKAILFAQIQPNASKPMTRSILQNQLIFKNIFKTWNIMAKSIIWPLSSLGFFLISEDKMSQEQAGTDDSYSKVSFRQSATINPSVWCCYH